MVSRSMDLMTRRVAAWLLAADLEFGASKGGGL